MQQVGIIQKVAHAQPHRVRHAHRAEFLLWSVQKRGGTDHHGDR